MFLNACINIGCFAEIPHAPIPYVLLPTHAEPMGTNGNETANKHYLTQCTSGKTQHDIVLLHHNCKFIFPNPPSHPDGIIKSPKVSGLPRRGAGSFI
jgi:hypothetical protein